MDEHELDYDDDYDYEPAPAPRRDDPQDDNMEMGSVEANIVANALNIEPKKAFKVSVAEATALRIELGADGPGHDQRSVLVKGVDGLDDFAIEKIFATFRASDVSRIDDSTAIVNFITRKSTAAMLLNMTKALRRVRAKKRAEEDGEVIDEDEEEGQIMVEDDDEVAVIDDQEARTVTKEFVTVNVDQVNVPKGKWRVVTQHVPANRLLIVRFPRNDEIEFVNKKRAETRQEGLNRKRKVVDNEFWSNEDRSRPGLNIFDDKGNELDWDYEHDTRFYDGGEREESTISSSFELPKTVKSRGRGSKKAGVVFGSNSESLLSDDKDQIVKKVRKDANNTFYEKDDVLARNPNSSRLEGRLEYL